MEGKERVAGLGAVVNLLRPKVKLSTIDSFDLDDVRYNAERNQKDEYIKTDIMLRL